MSFYEICGFSLSILSLYMLFSCMPSNELLKKRGSIVTVIGIIYALIAISVFIVGIGKIICNQ